MRKSMGRYSESAVPGELEQPPTPPQFRCMAHGCPVVAGIEAGKGEYVCRFHHATAPAKWSQATAALRDHEWLVHLTQLCWTPEIHGFERWGARAANCCSYHGRDDLAPRVDVSFMGGKIRAEYEHPKLYAHRLEAAITTEVIRAAQ